MRSVYKIENVIKVYNCKKKNIPVWSRNFCLLQKVQTGSYSGYRTTHSTKMIIKELINDPANAKTKKIFLKPEPIQEFLFYFFG